MQCLVLKAEYSRDLPGENEQSLECQEEKLQLYWFLARLADTA